MEIEKEDLLNEIKRLRTWNLYLSLFAIVGVLGAWLAVYNYFRMESGLGVSSVAVFDENQVVRAEMKVEKRSRLLGDSFTPTSSVEAEEFRVKGGPFGNLITLGRVTEHGTGMSFRGKNMNSAIDISQGIASEGGRISLSPLQGMAHMSLTSDENGSLLSLADNSGKARIKIAVDKDGKPSITLLDELGRVSWSAPPPP